MPSEFLCRLADLPAPKIAVLRALKLGDMLCAVPALRSLRAGLPHAQITLIGLPWADVFVDRYRAYLDRFLPLPGYPGLPEQPVSPKGVVRFLAHVQREPFDLVLQMQGSGSFVNPLVELMGARRSAGFFTPGGYCPDKETYLPYPDSGLEIRRLLKLVAFLGFPMPSEELEFPLRADDFASLHALAAEHALGPGNYICLHPGASVPERRWPIARFATVARTLGERDTIVITGSAGETELAHEVQRLAGVRCMNACGKTDLGSLAALLRDARVLVCNDTGVSHMAAALRVPSVVISTGDNPARWAPIDARLHRVFCDDRGVPAEAVLHAAQEQLALDARSASHTPVRTSPTHAASHRVEAG